MIALGSSEMSKAYVGSTEVSKMYLGSELVYTKEVLPYDSEIEYLRGTGTQYIDSGIECTGGLSIKCKFRCSTLENSAVAGGIHNLGSSYFRNHLSPYNKHHYYLSIDSSSIQLTQDFTANTWYVIEVDAVNGICKINGNSKTFTAVADSYTTNANYGIFARLSDNMNIQLRSGNTDIEYFQLIKNGSLVRDFIPVRVGQVGYMYDKVSKQLFGNVGSGSFILGDDIGVLPYDAQVEYLESSNKAYIDTGIKASGNLHIKTYLVDYFIEANLGKWAFGGRDGYNNNVYGLYINSNTKKIDYTYYNTSASTALYSSFPQSCWVEMQQGSIKINNTTYTFTTRTFTSSYNLILFGLNNGGNIVNGSGLKFGATYITNGTVTLDLIPVRKNGIGYMYDKNSGLLFGNANSQGSFIYGNDITV